MKTVIITGCRGQDGSYLADIYIERGWKVVGIDKWEPTGQYTNLKNVINNKNFILETGDITDREFIYHIITKYKPDCLYNMAAISLVPESFKIPRRVFEVNTLGVLNILETIKYYSPNTRYYQASSSEQWGENKEIPHTLNSAMLPNSPYAVSKVASFFLTKLYRNYGLFCVNGILNNHESERRGETFVTRKITKAVANIYKGHQQFITLGNLDTKRDWGYAPNFCESMILMMESDKADDYIVATGETHTIREFVEEAFKHIGLTIIWRGEGINEVGYDQNGVIRVNIDEKYYRPAEVHLLCGDYSKIKEKLGWSPKVKFKELVRIMIESDLNGN